MQDDIEETRYNTIGTRGDNAIHKRKARAINQQGNLTSPSENSSQISYDRETREKEINRREALKLILN